MVGQSTTFKVNTLFYILGNPAPDPATCPSAGGADVRATVSGQRRDRQSDRRHVFGYMSERNFQLERGSQWDRGKGCDTFGPIGPWLVTADEVGDPQNLDVWLDLNGERMQTGSTKAMIFGAVHLVSYISRFITLMPVT